MNIFLEKLSDILGAILSIAENLLPALLPNNNRQSKKSKKHPKRWSHLFVFPVVFVYFELLLRLFTGTGFFAHIIFPVLFGIAAGFFFAALTSFFSRKNNRILTLVLLFVFALIFIVECLVKRSFQFYMPLRSMLNTADDVAGGYLGETFTAILFGIPAIVLFFLPAILYLLYGKKYIPAKHYSPINVLKIFGYSVIVMLIAVLFANIGDAGLKYKRQYKFDTATEYFGLVTSLRLDTKYALFGNKDAESFILTTPTPTPTPPVDDSTVTPTPTPEIIYDENKMDLPLDKINQTSKDDSILALNQYVASLTPSKQNEYTGIFKGKNLILICAEALSDVVIDERLTPTLYRMSHNGFYFSEFYQPNWGGSTSSGEYSFLVGLVPRYYGEGMLSVMNNNLYFTMGNQLQRQGYFSRAYHNGRYDYYSRNETHENLGYDQFLALGNGLENISGNWPTDQKMIDATLETYIDQQPFSIYYMSVSGHSTYVADNKKTTDNIEHVRSIMGNKYKDTTLYYLCYQMELEKALTSLIEKLETAGILNDTVICLTSDHYPYGLEGTATFGNTEDYVADLYGYDPSNDWELDRNACLIWSGSLENEHKHLVCEIDTPTYSLDILPTLSNLFGLEYDSRLLVGRDVFSDAEPLVLWNTYSWATVEGKYDGTKGVFYPNPGSTADDDYVEYINAVVANKVSFSTKVVSTDYYRVLFGEDND